MQHSQLVLYRRHSPTSIQVFMECQLWVRQRGRMPQSITWREALKSHYHYSSWRMFSLAVKTSMPSLEEKQYIKH